MTFQIDADLLGNPRRALAPREDGHRSPGSQGRLATAAGPPHSAAFTVPARASTLLSAQAGLIRTGVAAVARGPIILICEPGCVGSSTDEHAAGCSCAALSIVSLQVYVVSFAPAPAKTPCMALVQRGPSSLCSHRGGHAPSVMLLARQKAMVADISSRTLTSCVRFEKAKKLLLKYYYSTWHVHTFRRFISLRSLQGAARPRPRAASFS